MRIEAGQTLPSEDLLNRLKAVQLIGMSKFRELSHKDREHFRLFVNGIGESADDLAKNTGSQMVKALTPAGILAGLAASTKYSGRSRTSL